MIEFAQKQEAKKQLGKKSLKSLGKGELTQVERLLQRTNQTVSAREQTAERT